MQPMSALGQTRPNWPGDTPINVRFAPKADIRFTLWHVCLVPKADKCTAANCSLFNHLVSACEHGYRPSGLTVVSVSRLSMRSESARHGTEHCIRRQCSPLTAPPDQLASNRWARAARAMLRAAAPRGIYESIDFRSGNSGTHRCLLATTLRVYSDHSREGA